MGCAGAAPLLPSNSECPSYTFAPEHRDIVAEAAASSPKCNLAAHRPACRPAWCRLARHSYSLPELLIPH